MKLKIEIENLLEDILKKYAPAIATRDGLALKIEALKQRKAAEQAKKAAAISEANRLEEIAHSATEGFDDIFDQIRSAEQTAKDALRAALILDQAINRAEHELIAFNESLVSQIHFDLGQVGNVAQRGLDKLSDGLAAEYSAAGEALRSLCGRMNLTIPSMPLLMRNHYLRKMVA